MLRPVGIPGYKVECVGKQKDLVLRKLNE